jgi:hypothetical protein
MLLALLKKDTYLFVLYVNKNILVCVSQFTPLNPVGQLHKKPDPFIVHVPPFWQTVPGVATHGCIAKETIVNGLFFEQGNSYRLQMFHIDFQ